MSPEQMSSQYYDYKIDVWGIGCVLFYLLYNKYPFNGRDMNELKKYTKKKILFLKIIIVMILYQIIYKNVLKLF